MINRKASKPPLKPFRTTGEDKILPEIPIEVRFVGTEYKNYICSICIEVCNKPRQCKDGHLFCFECIQKQIEHSPTCPLCRQEITLDSISRNLIAEKQTENLPVWCRYHFELIDDNWAISESGCGESMPSIQVATHEKQCQFGWVSCYFSTKCEKIRKKDIKDHEKDCIYRTTDCEFCFGVFQLSVLPSHQLECLSVPVECECCGVELIRGELEQHTKENCEEAYIQCSFFCKELIKRKDLGKHNTEYMVDHLNYMREDMQKKHIEELKERDDKILDLGNKIDILNKRILSLAEGALIQWKIEWAKIENENYIQSSFFYEELKLTIWLYPNGDTEESKGHISLYLFNDTDREEREFRLFQNKEKKTTEYVRKLKYYFEMVNFHENCENVRSGDIAFSLYPTRGASLMKGERKMIKINTLTKESGFLNDSGELCLNLHIAHMKTLIIL